MSELETKKKVDVVELAQDSFMEKDVANKNADPASDKPREKDIDF